MSATIARMKHPLFPVAVVRRCVPLRNRWVSEKWELSEVRPVAEEASAISRSSLPDSGWLWRGFTLDLHPSEGEGYGAPATQVAGAPGPTARRTCGTRASPRRNRRRSCVTGAV